jgi:hypothetical protein
MSRYFADLLGILLIALAVNLLLREVGVVNSLLRIIIALVVGRVIVSLVRRRLDARS